MSVLLSLNIGGPMSNAPRPIDKIYQVDYSHIESGKHIQHTKRRVRFVFGFASVEALETGLSGTECRGDEHEVVLVWSWTSGKQTILLDGEEIYRNVERGFFGAVKKFERSFVLKQHILTLSGGAGMLPGFCYSGHQFDLKVDGLSFFEMKRIYQLGEMTPSSSFSVQQEISPCATPVSLRETNMLTQEDKLVRLAKQQMNKQEGGGYKTSPTNTATPSPSPASKPPIIIDKNPQEDKSVSSVTKPPNQIQFSPDASTYQTSHRDGNGGEQEEPWESLVDIGSLKDGISVDGRMMPDYFEYYEDYVKRGGEPITKPVAPPPPPRFSKKQKQQSGEPPQEAGAGNVASNSMHRPGGHERQQSNGSMYDDYEQNNGRLISHSGDEYDDEDIMPTKGKLFFKRRRSPRPRGLKSNLYECGSATAVAPVGTGYETVIATKNVNITKKSSFRIVT